jgi:hypothetical protein
MSLSRPVHRNVEEHLAVVRDDRPSATHDPSTGKTNNKGIRIVALEIGAL